MLVGRIVKVSCCDRHFVAANDRIIRDYYFALEKRNPLPVEIAHSAVE